MNILGISAFYHDSAACLLRDGRVVAAAQEERFTRKKNDASFPANAAAYCLKEGGLPASRLDAVAFYEKPFVKFDRLLETYVTFAPRGFRSFLKAIPVWLEEKLWIPDVISKALQFEGPVLFPSHHESHAASAFYPSPFARAAFLTMDGVGEWATASFGFGEGNQLKTLGELRFPHSLGLLYSAFTYFTGFKVNSGEYKVMGLAPYGEPKFVQAIYDHLIDLKDDGSFTMNMDFFNYGPGLTMTSNRFHRLFGGPPRKPETPLTQRDMDLARSVQDVTEEVVLRMARHVRKTTGEKNVCLAGGVALNCVANGKLKRAGLFDGLWIQPAAGDAGGALGAALAVHHHHFKKSPPPKTGRDLLAGSYLGPAYAPEDIERFLTERGAPSKRFDAPAALADETAALLAQGQVVGWFQGRMEFGPRALGNRSILADPRGTDTQKRVNLKIKFRESFRPFAPSVLVEEAAQWFELEGESPYMLLVADVKKERQRPMNEDERGLWGIERLNVPRSEIPAATHVDYSARIQTVHPDDNRPYYDLLRAFFQKTGCPVLLNTSFNVRGEPIVESPADAYRCFMRTGLDVLVLGPYLLRKSEQPAYEEKEDWKSRYELD